MNYGKRFQNNLAALCVLTFIFSGCSVLKTKPPVPVFVSDTVPSWDGEEQNGGLIDYVEGKGYLITPNAAARYSYLTEIYANDYSPPLEKAVGLTKDAESANYYLSTQYMVEFVVMNSKYKSSIDPKPGSSK